MIRDILTLQKQGASIKQIARQLNISRNTVRDYLRTWEANGKGIDPAVADDLMLYEKIILMRQDAQNAERISLLHSRFEHFERELGRPGVTKKRLWQEYKKDHPQGFQLTQFCAYFGRWQNQKQVVMRQNHKCGDKMFVDFSGELLPFQLADGTQKFAQVFVAILGFSQFIYVEALESQKLIDFIGACGRAIRAVGGVPAAIVPDNLKSAVKHAHRYSADHNEVFSDFAAHYGTSIFAARAAAPRDKALVEGAVRIIYQEVFAPLRNHLFTAIADLNTAIVPLTAALNGRTLSRRDCSRQDLLQQHERPFLRPLPPTEYPYRQFRELKVPRDYHVFLKEDQHYYSVPSNCAGSRVRIIFSENTLEVYHQHQRVATHTRCRSAAPSARSTQTAHLAPAHREHARFLLTASGTLCEQALAIGPFVGELVKEALLREPHVEKGARNALGILRLTKKYPSIRIEQAARRALRFEVFSVRNIEHILQNNLDQIPLDEEDQPHQAPIPPHQNVRGDQYYQ
jgi:transposase